GRAKSTTASRGRTSPPATPSLPSPITVSPWSSTRTTTMPPRSCNGSRHRADLSPCTSTRGAVCLLSKYKGTRISTGRRTHRTTTGHARPPHPQALGARPSARLGDLGAPPPDLEQRAPDPAGLALPAPSPPRAAGPHQTGVGRVRQQPPRQVLRADAQRPQAARGGGERLAQARRRRRTGAGRGIENAEDRPC